MPAIARPVAGEADLETMRLLLKDYAAYLNRSLGEEHICLRAYEQELASLPGVYAAPRGALLLAFVDDLPAGCAALKPLSPTRGLSAGEAACEMKRLWVPPAFRGRAIGLLLSETLIDHARSQHYTAMYLDTVPSVMRSANHLYQKLGFEPVERYDTNPILGEDPSIPVEFFRLALA